MSSACVHVTHPWNPGTCPVVLGSVIPMFRRTWGHGAHLVARPFIRTSAWYVPSLDRVHYLLSAEGSLAPLPAGN